MLRWFIPGSVVLLVALASGAYGSGPAAGDTRGPSCLGRKATIVGTAKADRLTGTKKADVIAGLGGNDSIDGLGAADRICGGPGLDALVGGAGSDRLDGGSGFDVCRAGEQLSACEEVRRDAAVGPLRSGEYTTDLFRPRFSFRVGEDWQVRHRVPTAFQIAKRRDPRGLIVELDSFGGSRSVAARLEQLTSFSGVQADPAVNASIGGMAGKRVDLLVTAATEIPLPGLSAYYELEPNDRLRVYVVSVRGTSVAVIVEAPADEFVGFFAEVEDVLASVKWA